MNFGNSIVEIQQKYGREKEKKWERENFEFRQSHYRNSCCPNLLIETNCGNAIAEIGEFFFFLVAIPLPKMGGKKKKIKA